MIVSELQTLLAACDQNGKVKLSLSSTLVDGDDESRGDYISGVIVRIESSAKALANGQAPDRVIIALDPDLPGDEFIPID